MILIYRDEVRWTDDPYRKPDDGDNDWNDYSDRNGHDPGAYGPGGSGPSMDNDGDNNGRDDGFGGGTNGPVGDSFGSGTFDGGGGFVWNIRAGQPSSILAPESNLQAVAETLPTDGEHDSESDPLHEPLGSKTLSIPHERPDESSRQSKWSKKTKLPRKSALFDPFHSLDTTFGGKRISAQADLPFAILSGILGALSLFVVFANVIMPASSIFSIVTFSVDAQSQSKFSQRYQADMMSYIDIMEAQSAPFELWLTQYYEKHGELQLEDFQVRELVGKRCWEGIIVLAGINLISSVKSESSDGEFTAEEMGPLLRGRRLTQHGHADEDWWDAHSDEDGWGRHRDEGGPPESKHAYRNEPKMFGRKSERNRKMFKSIFRKKKSRLADFGFIPKFSEDLALRGRTENILPLRLPNRICSTWTENGCVWNCSICELV